MSNVVGGSYNSSSSSGYGYGGSSASSGYGNVGGYGSKEQKKKKQEPNYSYGNSVGHFGNYSYEKSTIDKYRDAKAEKQSSTDNKKEEKKPEIQVETKKSFQTKANKLVKPG